MQKGWLIFQDQKDPKNHQQSGKLCVAEKLTGEDKSEPGGIGTGGEQMEGKSRPGRKKERRWVENGGVGEEEGILEGPGNEQSS